MADPIHSDYATLDVKAGRVALARRVVAGDDRIPVTIRGYITGINSEDDGDSIEFRVEVTECNERQK